MEDRIVKYTIYKNKVWLEIIYKGVPMSCKSVYECKSRKDCERWVKEHVKENRQTR